MVEIPSSVSVVTPCTVHHLIRFEGLQGGVTKSWVGSDTMYYISFETLGGSEKSRLLNVSSSVSSGDSEWPLIEKPLRHFAPDEETPTKYGNAENPQVSY